MKQLILDMGLESEPSLQNFCVAQNIAFWEHFDGWLSSVSTNSAASALFNPNTPLYIWGQTGCGKTHVLHAATKNLQTKGFQVGWLDAKTTQFLDYNEAWCAVIFDDVGNFNDEQQQLAFNWFINAKTYKASILSSGQQPPSSLRIRDDLRTRMGWGDVFHLTALDDTSCRHVIWQEANSRGIEINDDVLDYLLHRFNRDIVNLKGLLNVIDHFSLENKRSVTIPLIKLMLDSI